jgi:pyrroline-5-carboxylate reductase
MIIVGIIKSSLVTPENVIASKTSMIEDAICCVTTSNNEVVNASDIIIIAVKVY